LLKSTGSGFIINNLSHNLNENSNVYYGIDINNDACKVTKFQSKKHETNVEVINSNGLSGLQGLIGFVDIFIFNPVYL